MAVMSEMSDRLNRLLAQASTYRSRAEVTGFFGGLELVDPGVVPIQQWRPDAPEEASAIAAMPARVCGMARSPISSAGACCLLLGAWPEQSGSGCDADLEIILR
jgi:hypothetical protein